MPSSRSPRTSAPASAGMAGTTQSTSSSSSHGGNSTGYYEDVRNALPTTNTMPQGEVDFWVNDVGVSPNQSVAQGRINLFGQQTSQPPGGWPPGPGGSSGRRYGGGGGGAGAMAFPGIDQPSFGWGQNLIEQMRPHEYEWQDLNVDPYQPLDYYEFDPSMYDRARRGVREGVAADRRYGDAAFGRGREEIGRYQNPFTGAYAQAPGINEAMRRMIEANGGLGARAYVSGAGEAAQADQAMGGVLAGLQGLADQRQAYNMRALDADQGAFQERLNTEARNLGFGADMAEARARSQYDKERFGYEAGNQRQLFEDMLGLAMYNNQGQNQTRNKYLEAINAFRQGRVAPLMELMLAGIDPKTGKQTLNVGQPDYQPPK